MMFSLWVRETFRTTDVKSKRKASDSKRRFNEPSKATTTRNSFFFFFFNCFVDCSSFHLFLFAYLCVYFFSSYLFFSFVCVYVCDGFRILLLSALLMVMTGCQPGSAVPRLNNAMLWKRLGLNRAIGSERPQITSSKKKGESTVYFIKLPPQPHYYIPLNILPSSGGSSSSGFQQKSTPDPFETVNIRLFVQTCRLLF